MIDRYYYTRGEPALRLAVVQSIVALVVVAVAVALLALLGGLFR